jgi:hypothetical protein
VITKLIDDFQHFPNSLLEGGGGERETLDVFVAKRVGNQTQQILGPIMEKEKITMMHH